MSIPLESLTLVAATPAQAKVTRLNTFPYWGAPRGYTMEFYVKRDELMEQEEWGADDFLITWVLVPRDDLKTTEKIYSHCETYRRTAVIRAAPVGGELKEVVGYGIASVFTPNQFRRSGYAKRMLELLHYVLAPKEILPPFPESFGAPPPPPRADRAQDAAFSVLYSDIGEAYYKGCLVGQSLPGWAQQGSTGRCWVLEEGDVAVKGEEEDVRWLGREETRAMEESVSEVIKQGLLSAEDDGKIKAAFLPTGGLLSLHALRHILSSPSPLAAPPSFGFHRPSTSSSVFYTFSDETKPHQTLLILAMAGNPSWEDVVRAARKEGCDRVEIWGDDAVSRGWKSGKGVIVNRDDHLSQICYYGPEGKDGVDWRFNEKYAWC